MPWAVRHTEKSLKFVTLNYKELNKSKRNLNNRWSFANVQIYISVSIEAQSSANTLRHACYLLTSGVSKRVCTWCRCVKHNLPVVCPQEEPRLYDQHIHRAWSPLWDVFFSVLFCVFHTFCRWQTEFLTWKEHLQNVLVGRV